MQYIRSYFTPLNEPPPVYVGYLDRIPINTLLQEAKVRLPNFIDIETTMNDLNMDYDNDNVFIQTNNLEIQLQKRRCLGAIIDDTIVVSKFYTVNSYTLIKPRNAIKQFNNIKDLMDAIRAETITNAICVYDKEGAYKSKAVLLLRESLKTQARFNEITTDDATILKNKFTTLNDLLNDILTKNGATILSLFNNNIRVRNAFNQAESTAKLNTIIQTQNITTIDDFIYWVNDTNETTFLRKEQQHKQQQEQEQEQERQDKLLQAQQAQTRHNAAIQASKDAYDRLNPTETRDRELITNTVLEDNVKYGHDVLNKKTNFDQNDLIGKFVILYIKKTTGDDQIAQGLIQDVQLKHDLTLEELTIKGKKYRFLKERVEHPNKIMFDSLMFIPDVATCFGWSCYGGKKKSKRRISRKYKKKTTRRVVFSRNKKRVRNL